MDTRISNKIKPINERKRHLGLRPGAMAEENEARRRERRRPLVIKQPARGH